MQMKAKADGEILMKDKVQQQRVGSKQCPMQDNPASFSKNIRILQAQPGF
jgi:hypothetical protein